MKAMDKNSDDIQRKKIDSVFENFPYTVARHSVYKDFKSRLNKTMAPVWWKRIYKVAANVAAILFIPLAVYTIYLIDKSASVQMADSETVIRTIPKQIAPSMEYYVNPGVKGKIELPDGSLVWMNSNSKIKYPARFDSLERKLDISGEVYFKVVSNKDWPMVINTSKGVTVKVLGTEFNLSSYENDDYFALTLVKGNVEVSSKSFRQPVQVLPNEKIVISDNTLTRSSKAKTNVEYDTAWKEGYLVFEATPMLEVIKRMERWYGVSFTIKNMDILNYKFTATFNSESLTQVLELLNISSNIKYKISENEVFLSL